MASGFGEGQNEVAGAEKTIRRARHGTPARRRMVSIQRMAFGTADGGTETSPSLIVRWFDGFVRTELRVTRLPSSMPLATSCPDCTGSLIEQLSIAPITQEGVSVGVGKIQVSITGDPVQIRTVIDSLVAVD